MDLHRLKCLAIALMIFLGLPTFAGGEGAGTYRMAECKECHSQGSSKSLLKIDMKGFESSVHAAGFQCIDCHQNVLSDKHILRAGSGTVNCFRCHQKINRHGGESSSASRPQCHQCHTRHRMYRKTNPASSVHRNSISATCQRCHPEESGRMTYLSWLPSIRIESHNKQDLGTVYGSGDCLGCHQGQAAHGETQTLVQANCHECHLTPDGENALLGTMHPKADLDAQPGVYAIAFMYQLGIIFLLWGGLRRIISRERPPRRS